MKPLRITLSVFVLLLFASPLQAGVPTKVLKETLEAVTKKFGRESLGEGTEAFMKRLDDQATRFGQETVTKAVRAAGPSALHVAARYGDDAGAIYRVFARWGTKAARICDDPKLARLFIKHGDEAAEAMIKHPGVAAQVVGAHGDEGARALLQLSRQNGGRLARLSGEGLFSATPQHAGLMGVVRRFGDGGLDFIWRHKGLFATAAVLTAFLSDPEPYIEGLKELGAEVAGTVIAEMGETADWNLLVPSVVAVLAAAGILFWGLKFGFRKRTLVAR